ncbi:hypothetical protein ENH_00045630 [Eimeria necatrix]|uniref:DNA/RNA non-specific endonuclease domain-containing protein n=1 Tax=Eimeria necatrix TaxID=51315 RepID=U6MZM9_9EIME|nr:hypothetical protein ENH_00045630 [Eimeria necatrix]CDJ67964.1 hypothetical protein ENH_00045630 [Eimeria necatrix]
MNIEFDVLGYNLTPVPTHFFKVFLGVNPRDLEENKQNDMPPNIGQAPVDSKKAAWPKGTPPPSVFGAFVVPNKAMYHRMRAERFRVPLSFIELVTGIDFGVVRDIIDVAEGKSVEDVVRQRTSQAPRSLARRTETAHSASGRFRGTMAFTEEENALVENELKLLKYDICSVFHPKRTSMRVALHKRTFCKYS